MKNGDELKAKAKQMYDAKWGVSHVKSHKHAFELGINTDNVEGRARGHYAHRLDTGGSIGPFGSREEAEDAARDAEIFNSLTHP